LSILLYWQSKNAWENWHVRYDLHSGLLLLREHCSQLKHAHAERRWYLAVVSGITLTTYLLIGVACSSASGGSSGSTASSVGGKSGNNNGFSVCPNNDCSEVKVTDDCDGGTLITIGTGDVTTATGCQRTVNWESDAGYVTPTPPTTEDYACPAGTTRVHIRDIWSKAANPTLGVVTSRPATVRLKDTSNGWGSFFARLDSSSCDWYSSCIDLSNTGDLVMSVQAEQCGSYTNDSGTFTLKQYAKNSDVWLDYSGTSSTITADYSNYPNKLVIGAGNFRITSNKVDVASELCSDGKAPETDIPSGSIRLHFRWLWSDPTKTGFAGTGCEEQLYGFATPPYPTSLNVTVGNCTGAAMLELQNSDCPWYTLDVPKSQWVAGSKIKVTYADYNQRALSGVTLPEPTANEYWLAYGGPPDNITSAEAQACTGRYDPNTLTYFYTKNPGPGYAGCGGDSTVTVDPCNPVLPNGYHTVHFRYLWAGQKTFTYFPKPEFMPKWIILRVHGNGAKEIACFREADRPWFGCPVPDELFVSGATWVAADLTRAPTEWNTVDEHTFPSTPGEYWIRWTYGKPDYSESDEERAKKFTVYDFYPDGIGGDYSAVGNWGDGACAAKPAANTSMHLGYDGWFPYDETNYAYPFGGSLAKVYPSADMVQQLLNYMVQERYEFWKAQYIETKDRVCGADTARVAWRDRNSDTVSEGQGYGMAITAAIGDKATFDKLWNFVRHFLSQSAKKYCGGLMGWNWKGDIACRELDQPCDPFSEHCGGDDDSAFDGDVDIAIGLVYAAMQWPEYRSAAINWITKMECEVNPAYDGKWNYPSNGDTANKDCSGQPNSPCVYVKGSKGPVLVNYYPPGYFRVFGDFLKKYMTGSDSEKQGHHDFWYKAASTVYEMLERCYDQTGVHPALTTDSGDYDAPCNSSIDNYNWARYMWRVGIDAAWFGNREDFVENAKNTSRHYSGKSEMQAKIDLIQDFFLNFHVNNPVEPNANRFSSICQNLMPDGTVKNCDPGFGHNSYFVNTAMCSYASIFDNDGKTTPDIRKEALEEAVSTTIENNRYYQESIGVYTLLFLTGNFPNPLTVQ
jgi:hypothetical protein